MKPENEHYERIGRWIDGESVDLTDQQRELARQIQADQQLLAAALDVAAPAAAMERAQRRMLAAAAKPKRRLMLHVSTGLVAGVAAAAVLAIGLTLWRANTQPMPSKTDAMLVAFQYETLPVDEDLDLLARELDDLRDEFSAVTTPSQLDVDLDALQRQLEQFWLIDSQLHSDA